MKWPPPKREGAIPPTPIPKLNLSKTTAPGEPLQAREILFHSLATQHLQRVQIIELLSAIDGKLAILVDAALRDERRLLP
jgi:hypothetical protein